MIRASLVIQRLSHATYTRGWGEAPFLLRLRSPANLGSYGETHRSRSAFADASQCCLESGRLRPDRAKAGPLRVAAPTEC